MRMSRSKPASVAGFAEEAKPLHGARSKRAVNVSVSRALVDEAKALGVNLSETLEAALQSRLKAAREQAVRDEIRSAVDAFNEDFDRNGLWSDGIRPW